MKWKLHDKKWNIVAEIELPDDAPDVVIFEGRIFHYDERVERYVSPTIYVVASDPASALEEPKIVNAPPLFAGEPIAQPGSTENKSCSMTAAKEANIKTAKVVSITGELRGAISKSPIRQHHNVTSYLRFRSHNSRPGETRHTGLTKGETLLPFSYSCPDCGWDVESLVGEVTSDNGDAYQPIVCPNCQQLHSVNTANGEVIAADELGDPW